MKIKLRGGVSLAEQISFYRQLAVTLRSGLPLFAGAGDGQCLAAQRCPDAVAAGDRQAGDRRAGLRAGRAAGSDRAARRRRAVRARRGRRDG